MLLLCNCRIVCLRSSSRNHLMETYNLKNQLTSIRRPGPPANNFRIRLVRKAPPNTMTLQVRVTSECQLVHCNLHTTNITTSNLSQCSNLRESRQMLGRILYLLKPDDTSSGQGKLLNRHPAQSSSLNSNNCCTG